MKKLWVKSATLQDFAEIEIGDWLEGVGMIMSHFEKDFIRRFGHYLTSQSSRQITRRENCGREDPLSVKVLCGRCRM